MWSCPSYSGRRFALIGFREHRAVMLPKTLNEMEGAI